MCNCTSAGRRRQEGVRRAGVRICSASGGGTWGGLYSSWLLPVDVVSETAEAAGPLKKMDSALVGEKLVLISSSVMQSLLKVEAVRGMKACSDSDWRLRTSEQEILWLVWPFRQHIKQLFGMQQMSARAYRSYRGFWVLVCYRLCPDLLSVLSGNCQDIIIQVITLTHFPWIRVASTLYLDTCWWMDANRNRARLMSMIHTHSLHIWWPQMSKPQMTVMIFTALIKKNWKIM